MQKGFATLEIILFTLIIAVLATATLPNAARIIDRVALDY
ncbi:MAG: type II secretion system protein [Selenomonadaceae bacterium]|nr:type II secretion system protein [Selenomonadaceae bacterium]